MADNTFKSVRTICCCFKQTTFPRQGHSLFLAAALLRGRLLHAGREAEERERGERRRGADAEEAEPPGADEARVVRRHVPRSCTRTKVKKSFFLSGQSVDLSC